MESETFTAEEMELIKAMCEAVQRTGINWPLAVSLFPPQDEHELSWKEKTLIGIKRASPQALKT